MMTDKELLYLFRKTDDNITWGKDIQLFRITIEDEGIKTLVLGFSGSNSAEDWKNDFSFFKKPYKDMKKTYYAHGGFISAWKSCNDLVLESVKTAVTLEGVSQIYVLGHSFGAAMATLCGEDIWFNFPDYRDKIRVVVWGCPRVYSAFCIKNVKDHLPNYTRYENNCDIVPHVPFAWMLFKHLGKKVHIGDRKYSFFAFLSNMKEAFHDHSTSQYYKHMKED